LYKRPSLSQRKTSRCTCNLPRPHKVEGGECLASKREKKEADVFVPSLGPNRLTVGEYLTSKNLDK